MDRPAVDKNTVPEQDLLESLNLDFVFEDCDPLNTAVTEFHHFSQSTPARDYDNINSLSSSKTKIRRRVKKKVCASKRKLDGSCDSERSTLYQINESVFSDTKSVCMETSKFDSISKIDDVLLSKTIIEGDKCNATGDENAESDNLTQCFANEFNKSLSKIRILLDNTIKSNFFEDTDADDEMLANLDVTGIIQSRTIQSYPANTFYSLPMNVKQVLTQTRGINHLYDWQHDCLCLQAVFQRQNLIYSLPTSGGKTLVAEILIMKELLVNQKNVILVLPYVSIVQEKVRDLSPFAVQLGFHIEEYAASKGSIPPKKRRNKRSVYIGTIEKANAIINSLIDLERTEELGMVVIDELHMIGEGGGRGALLEILLSKVLFKYPNVQIIGMSATLGNVNEIQQFLKAEVYTNNFRPVQLTEYVKIKDTVYQVFPESKTDEELCRPVRTVAFPTGLNASISSKDPDFVLPLVMEVIPGNSCLIFCPTKKNCENVALMLARSLPRQYTEVKSVERMQLMKTIHSTVNGVCKTLRTAIPFGIAYHHSGLTMDERKLIEDAYSTGILCLLCCTSTLAAGVNLPAKRVILRSPYVGNKFMLPSQYKQMVGRAGRAGIDSSGESILILQPKDKIKAKGLLGGLIGNCTSSLFYQDGKGLRELMLSLLGLKICSSDIDIQSFVSTTLFHVQNKGEKSFCVMDKIRKEVKELIKLGLVVERADEKGVNALETTGLGKASLKGCIDIDRAPFIYGQFQCAQTGLVLTSELHLLYLATPIDQVDGIYLNWMIFYQRVGKLNENEMKAAEAIGITESVLCRKAVGQRCSKVDEFVYKRFYLTMMLFQLMKKKSVWEIADVYNVARGFLQNLLSSAISFASLLIHFTEELPEFWSFKLLFQVLVDKLTHTNNLELAPLLDIPGVKQVRARQLFKSGYKTLQDIAWVEAKKLTSDVEYLSRRQAQLIISSAQMLLQEKIETLREEAEEISAAPKN